ncbi:methyl-accepting chemotaxis protein [Thauera sp. SDU_THAU2]|uniref:methyl-accepting chemotaxis protein n=1 Tax=Thauera sp. SDU_THAU2 TaxID=3136633 RepID=UPI00311EF28D
MKNNQPVTSVETPVPEGEFIYSRTDCLGNIVAANDLFVALSGFSREELIGQPHNLVRHPDMPSAAYVDMWRALKAGEPWSGYVKNRRKDGGFYWVRAFVSPVRENGKVIGYESVRRHVDRATIAEVDAAYRRMRAHPGRFEVRDGRVARAGLAGRLSDRSLAARFGLGLGVAAAGAVMLALAALGGWALPDAWLWAALAVVLAAIGWLQFGVMGGVRADLCRLRETMSAAQRDGDLRRVVHVEGGGEVRAIGDAFNAMMANLQAILINVREAAERIVVQSDTLKQSSGLVSDGAAGMSEAASSTAAAVEQVTVAVGEVAEHALASAEAARETQRAAAEGMAQAERAVSEIGQLARAVGETAAGMDRLRMASGEIGNIAIVIKEIADQTNLLALNAAIEAARAGEWGRGFAVVADEVRKLAERTTAATGEIGAIIGSLHDETRTAVGNAESGSTRVRLSVGLIEETQAALAAIRTSAENSLGLVDGIELATREQSAAVTSIAGSVEGIARRAGESSVAVSGIAGASRGLAEVSCGLDAALARIKV